jgi:hypothetical protein
VKFRVTSWIVLTGAGEDVSPGSLTEAWRRGVRTVHPNLRTSVASDVRHTLVCRDLTDEVYHRDERETGVCRKVWSIEDIIALLD